MPIISMDDFVNENFKMTRYDCAEWKAPKKDKAQTVYVDLGTKRGIQKGQKFICLHRDGHCR